MSNGSHQQQELHELDAAALSREFARGAASSIHVLERVRLRIERYSDALGLFNAVADWDAIFEAAQESDNRWAEGEPLSPVDGIPFAVKANIAIRGLPWHGGIAAYGKRVANEDAGCVAVLRSAGMIPVGILNMHEAALGETGDNPAFQKTLNPRDRERIAGGSSSGCAAAVAAGVVPVALGTDDMGSVRLPSALCGVVGYKPDHGVIPLDGVVPLSPRLDHVGVHARSVADIRSVLRLFDRNAISRIQPEHIAVWQLGESIALAPEVAAAFAEAIDELNVGHRVDWRDVDLAALRRAGLLRCERDGFEQFALDMTKRPKGFSPELRKLLEWGSEQSDEKVARADALLTELGERLRNDVSDQVMLSPTTPHVAPRWDEDVPLTLADLTAPAAIAGLPSISVPAPSTGLPVGVQITGGNYLQVLTLAEKVFPSTARVIAEEGEEIE